MSGAGACTVTRLRLHHFRNYAETTVRPAPGLNVIAGPNAQGKTNLLEGVATLALTRSPRASSASDLVQWESAGAQIEADVSRPAGDITLSARFERPSPTAAVVRRAMVDAKPRAARAVLGLCPVVLFWPDDLHLVKAGPDGRRRLLDVLLSQLEPGTAVHLVRYRRVLEQRNALLHRMRIGGGDATELEGFTQELAEHGAHIVLARRVLLERLIPYAEEALLQLSDSRERLGLRYVAAGGAEVEQGDVRALTSELVRALHARDYDERTRGVTLVGPHRDDVEIELAGRPARHTASQGQQRSIVLACKIAEMRYVTETAGMTPVVLLDDVVSELDAERRRHLLQTLATEPACQVLLTTTEPLEGADLFSSVRRFSVSAGHVQALDA